MNGFGWPLVRFILLRLLYSAIVLLGVIIVVFLLIQVVPGDPVRIALGTRYTPQAYDALRHASGLDQPALTQLVHYIGNVFTGDLGVSFRDNEPVTTTLLQRLPATIALALSAIVVALVISIPLGTWAAMREGRMADNSIRVLSQFGISVPDFWMGILLIAVFSTALGWLPSAGYRPLSAGPVPWLEHIILPAITVGAVTGAIMTRYVRTAVLEAANAPSSSPHSPRAQSPPNPGRTHRPQRAGTGADHLGYPTRGATRRRDRGGGGVRLAGVGQTRLRFRRRPRLPDAAGAILLIAAIFLIVNLVVDVLYAIIDPRIRLS